METKQEQDILPRSVPLDTINKLELARSSFMKNKIRNMTTSFISTDALLLHWQGHRRLTRKTIETFPDEKLYTYSIGGMRPFAELAMEMVRMASGGLRTVINGDWQSWEELTEDYPLPKTKRELLNLWDHTTDHINSLWSQIPSGRFQKRIVSFAGQYEGPRIEQSVFLTILYLIDNENHHRAQGYVYLRSLGLEPPPFWRREW